AVLDLSTVGVTRRPLVARGAPPGERRGSRNRFSLEASALVSGCARAPAGSRWWSTQGGGIDAETGVEIVLAVSARARTPEPLREARRLARTARATRLDLSDDWTTLVDLRHAAPNR